MSAKREKKIMTKQTSAEKAARLCRALYCRIASSEKHGCHQP
jgi:hypothetical protein